MPDGINFYENYGWSYYGDKIRPIALYNGHEHVYNGYYPDMTCAINIPDGYEFKEMKVEGDIPSEWENTKYRSHLPLQEQGILKSNHP